MDAEVSNLETEFDQLSRNSRRDQPEASPVSRKQQARSVPTRTARRFALFSRRRAPAPQGIPPQSTSRAPLDRPRSAEGRAIGESHDQRLEQEVEDTSAMAPTFKSLEEQLRTGCQAQSQLGRAVEPTAGPTGGIARPAAQAALEPGDIDRISDRCLGRAPTARYTAARYDRRAPTRRPRLAPNKDEGLLADG